MGPRPEEKRQSRVDEHLCSSTLLPMIRPPARSPYETSTNRRGATGRRRAASAGCAQIAAAPGMRRLVQVSCGWPRVGRASDLRARAARAGGPVAAGAHEKTRFLFKKRGLGTKARLQRAGRLQRRGRELGKRSARPSGRRLRGAKPPPAAPGAPRLRSRPQFLNANGEIWVQPLPPRRAPAGAGLRPAARGRIRWADPSGRKPAKREGAFRGQNPPSL